MNLYTLAHSVLVNVTDTAKYKKSKFK